MGSLKKKFAKTLRKITPKEIAPILPFLAMAIPGMQGLTPLLKFALPQLLTAAGSARQTGKINLMNQAMAGIGSLASMNAANAAAANTAAGTAAGANTPYINSLGNVAGGTTGTMTAQQLAAAQTTAETAALANNATSAVNPAMYANANINPDLYSSALNISGGSTVNNALNSAAQLVGNNQFVLPMGEAMNNPGFNLPYAMAVGGSGASMATADYAGKKELEFEEDKARDIASIGNYRDAQGNLTDYFTDRDYTLEDLYGVGNVPDFLRSNFLAANGGRAKLAGGGMSPGERNAREGHQNENSGSGGSGGSGGYNPHTPSGTSLGQQFAGQSMPGPGNMPNGGGGNGNVNENIFVGPLVDPNAVNDLQINPAVTFVDPLVDLKFNKFKDEEDDYGVVGNYLKDIIENKAISLTDNLNLGINKTGLELDYGFADGGRIGFSAGGDKNAAGKDGSPAPKKKNAYNPAEGLPEGLGQTEIYNAYMDKLPVDNAARQEYFTTGNPTLPQTPAANQSAFNYNNVAINNNNDVSDAIKNMLAYNQYAYGGRIGLANGGMEGIMGAMQAPGVPAGMELDYRSSGGFIPMGGPEKADDVPAMLSKNEFVMTADAVRGLGNGDIESGAQQMYDLMNNLEAQG